MRVSRANRKDGNQDAIVQALIGIGASVQVLNAVGNGCPDILAGWRGVNYAIEIKDPAKPPSKRKLRDSQEDWIAKWNGQVAVIETVDEAFALLGIQRRQANDDREREEVR